MEKGLMSINTRISSFVFVAGLLTAHSLKRAALKRYTDNFLKTKNVISKIV